MVESKKEIQLINIMIYTRTYPTKTTCIHAKQIIWQQQQQQNDKLQYIRNTLITEALIYANW